MRCIRPIVLIAVSVMALHAQTISEIVPKLKELRISSEGFYLGTVITIGDFDVILSETGVLLRTEMHLTPGAVLDYKFTQDNIEKSGTKKDEIWYYEGPRLKRIGTIEITYDPTYRDRISKIGSLEIGYKYFSGKIDQVDRVGNMRLEYEYPKKRIIHIGNIKIDYNYMNRIETLRTVTGKPESPKDLVITIEHPFSVKN
jgi:hypothetical protein